MKVLGSAMEPSLHPGQVIEVEEVSPAELERGDVIVFEIMGEKAIKRLIGLPGETLEIHDGKVLIDGQAIDEPYGPMPSRHDFGPLTLAENEFFVLGDNRDHSNDSRSYGPISGGSILQRAVP